MKRNAFLKRFLAMMLIFAIMTGYVLPGFAMESGHAAPSYVTFTQVDNSNVSASLTPNGRAELVGDTQYADTDVVRVSIVLKKASTIDAGFSTMNIAGNQAAIAYREGLPNANPVLLEPVGSLTGRPAPIAAAIGSSISETYFAPAERAAS